MYNAKKDPQFRILRLSKLAAAAERLMKARKPVRLEAASDFTKYMRYVDRYTLLEGLAIKEVFGLVQPYTDTAHANRS